GYVCTFSGLIIKGSSAHIFHLGDSRVYRIRQKKIQQITTDHRHIVSQTEHLLARALGINEVVDIDYSIIGIEPGDLFMLCTDGVYEFLDENDWWNIIEQHPNDLDAAASQLVTK